MELRQLQYFYTIAKYENLSKASEELFIAQSALSKSMTKLEEELEVQLFIRTSKNIRLSPAGVKLRDDLQSVLPSITGLKTSLHDYVEKHVETCTISVLTSMSMVSEIVTDYSKAFPNAKLSLTRSDDPAKIDLKFVVGSPNFDKEDTIFLRDQEIYVLVSKNSPLVKQHNLKISDLSEYSYIQNSTTSSLRNAISCSISSLCPNFSPRTTMSVGDYNVLCYLIENDLGYTFTPDVQSLLRRYDVELVSVENHSMRCPLYLVWDKNAYLSKATKNFIAYTCNYFGVSVPHSIQN